MQSECVFSMRNDLLKKSSLHFAGKAVFHGVENLEVVVAQGKGRDEQLVVVLAFCLKKNRPLVDCGA